MADPETSNSGESPESVSEQTPDIDELAAQFIALSGYRPENFFDPAYAKHMAATNLLWRQMVALVGEEAAHAAADRAKETYDLFTKG
jgi:hypothetical protein